MAKIQHPVRALQASCVRVKVPVVVAFTACQVLVTKTISLDATKILDVEPDVRDLHFIVRDGKVICQGVLHKQVFYTDTEGREAHLQEEIPFSEMKGVPDALGGDYVQVEDVTFNKVVEFDDVTGELTQKIIVHIEFKVLRDQQMDVQLDPEGRIFLLPVVIAEGTAQLFVTNTTSLSDAVKLVDIDMSLEDLRFFPKPNKIIVQGVLHKQVFYVGTDNLVHHQAERLPISRLVEFVPPVPTPIVLSGDEELEVQLESGPNFSIIPEFCADTGELSQKVVIDLGYKVVSVDQFGVAETDSTLQPLVKVHRVVGIDTCQVLVEKTIELPAVKVTRVDAEVRNLQLITRDGKVICQGILHKQVLFVGLDDLVHSETEEVAFHDLEEDVPGVLEGMDTRVEDVRINVEKEFSTTRDPVTGEITGGTLTQKVVIDIDFKVLESVQTRFEPCA